MRRSGFQHKPKVAETPQRVRTFPKPEPGAFRMAAAISGVASTAAKPEKLRNADLLKLARGEPCMLQIPGVCNHDPSTSVQCHSNFGAHGKGKGTKAHDCCSFSGCSACHFWLDQDSRPSRGDKHAATQSALHRQIERWKQWLKHSNQYSSKQRIAASWALSNLQTIAQTTPHAFDDCVHKSLNGVSELLLQ